MAMQSYGGQAAGLSTRAGDVTADNAATIISTDSLGSASVLIGQALQREVLAGVANGDWSITNTTVGSNIDNADEALPYWTFTDSSSGKITAQIVAQAASANGNALQFSVAANATATQSAKFTRYIPIAGNRNRSYAYQGEAYIYAWTGGATEGAKVSISVRWDAVDKDYALLTVNKSVSAAGTTTGSIVTDFAVPDATAAYLLITVTCSVTSNMAGAVTAQLLEVRTSRGESYIALPADIAAGTEPWIIRNDNGIMRMYRQNGQATGGNITLTNNSASSVYDVSIAAPDINGTISLNAGGYVLLDGNNTKANVLQLQSTTDASQSSTLNALTIGASKTSGQRLKMDTNELSSFSGTSGAELYLNPSGGNVSINSSVSNNYLTVAGGSLSSYGTATGSNVLQTFVTSDANNRFKIEQNGVISWGSGSATVDTNLYRNSAAQLKTDSTFTANGIESTSAINAAGAMSATNITLSGANGLRHDTPATTTQTASAAIWVVQSGTQYQLRRNSSSNRYKTDITDADDAVLQAAKKIQPRHYRSTIEDEDGATRLGFIAEEVEATGLTHAVGYDTEGRPETIDPTALIAALYHRVNELEERLAALEA